MQHLQTEVLVIGGGATGTGILRDLAMRGFQTILVERRDLAYGTTGRYHGLLHSGGRYAVKDPQAAQECSEENQILRRIMPQCIEDTGGFFVLTPWDDGGYADRFLAGCRQAGIPSEEISITQMLKEEPLLNHQITRCFRVPDGSADSFLAAELNVSSACQHGAKFLTYHEVHHLLLNKSGDRVQVCGASSINLISGEDVIIEADLVINASGAWAGAIANMADIKVQILPGKGSMIAVNHRVVNTVINRCKMPADGDILVPAHTVAVMGTTDIKVQDPNQFGIEPWEIQLMLSEGEKIIPGFNKFRILRAWAGVRPLFQETIGTQNRDVTRAFVLLDHHERDHVEGFLTITSGKWTTYRKMAEVTVDKACQKLGVQRACRTHQESLPTPEKHKTHNYHRLGERFHNIEQAKAYDQLVCECELATHSDVEKAITLHNSQTLDDIRRDVRLGMGPCQGGFCSYRAAGLLHELRHPEVEKTNASLRDFLQERWKGMHPVLWGQQLRQSRLNELIYLNVLNVEYLPGPVSTRLAPEPYTPPTLQGNEENAQQLDDHTHSLTVSPKQTFTGTHLDVLVIGTGLAGLVAGWNACKLGKKTRLISKGFGATHWSAGCIDMLGYLPGQQNQPLNSPKEGLSTLIVSNPSHPYALMSIEQIESALTQFQSIFAEAGYPMEGNLDHNWLLPTALGAIRPTCLAPKTMIAGDVRTREPMLIVGFSQYQDFYARLVADNLNAQDIIARDITIDLPELRNQRIFSSMSLARLFDTPEFRRTVVQAILPRLGNAKRIGFPAVLGLHSSLEVVQDLQELFGVPVFEIPGLPPSVPGIRLHNLLVQAIQALGGQVYSGVECVAATVVDQEVRSVISEAAARRKPHIAKNYILATGGFLGGGFISTESDYAQEAVFKLQLSQLPPRHEWFKPDIYSPQGHPIFRKGILVSRNFTPLDHQGFPILKNLAVVGGAMDGFNPLREHSLEGVALTSGYWAVANLQENANA